MALAAFFQAVRGVGKEHVVRLHLVHQPIHFLASGHVFLDELFFRRLVRHWFRVALRAVFRGRQAVVRTVLAEVVAVRARHSRAFSVRGMAELDRLQFLAVERLGEYPPPHDESGDDADKKRRRSAERRLGRFLLAGFTRIPLLHTPSRLYGLRIDE